jgi:putative DNA primase/helicase
MEAGHAEKHTEDLLTWQGDVERAKVERSLWQNMVKEAAESGLPHPPMPAVADEPATPERRRLYVQDATPESVGAVLSGNPAGTLCIRDELAGWLNFDRYSSGGGGREFWLEAYGGDSYTIDRKSNAKPIVIQFNGVSVCGGIQPDKLSDTLLGKGAPNDGLVARFLWAWPDEPEFERPRRAADNSDLVNVFSRLDGLGWGTGLDGRDVPVTIPLSPRAADLFEEFQRENRRCPTDAGPLFKAFVGKLDGMALRIALAVELAQWAYLGGQEPTEVSVQTIARVAEFLDSYAKPSAVRVFGDAALPVNERNAATLARYILREKVTAFNARSLRRAARLPGMKDAEAFNEAVSLLVDADWLRDAGKRDGGGPGRRTSDFVVNPAVHGGA